MKTNGSHLAVWDPNGEQRQSDFEFLGLKAAAAQLTAAMLTIPASLPAVVLRHIFVGGLVDGQSLNRAG
jgi:hypothetical protein